MSWINSPTAVIQIPRLNDAPLDFDWLFSCLQSVNQCPARCFIFDFTNCDFLKPNAVAFLGGVARWIERQGKEFVFDWRTLQQNIRVNLTQNGFLKTFGGSQFGAWDGNSVPYREDYQKNKNDLMDYLNSKWFGKNWVQVSHNLRSEVIGNAWEIYENAFEHGGSPWVISCGQRFPTLRKLQLTVIDFGVGIPGNVQRYWNNSGILAAQALKWAFERGNTTSHVNFRRGLGLDFLKEFVFVNQGKLEVFSHQGYALFDSTGERYIQRNTFFPGTLVNIAFQCDDSFYILNTEVGNPVF